VKLSSAALGLLALVLAVFTAVNWSAFTSPTQLSLIVTSVQAPLGVLMLFFTGAITVAFLALVVYLQASAALEARRVGKELKMQRDLADRAEASRFTELRAFVSQELAGLRALSADSDARLASRLEATERALRTDIEHAGNTLAAYIGELEHRLGLPLPDDAADRR